MALFSFHTFENGVQVMKIIDWFAPILVVVATPLVVIDLVCRVRRVLDCVREEILKCLPMV